MSEVSMRIDIDKLTEAELIDLNNRVVARLQFLAQMRWNVSPRLLGRADEPQRSGNPATNIVPLRKT